MITKTNLVRCPECGDYAIIVRGSQDFTKVTGWRDYPVRENTIDILCPKDKLILDWNPPLWKRILMGSRAWPPELRD